MLTCAKLFVEELKSKDLNFECGETESGAYVVQFPYNGKITKIFFDGENGQYMSMYLVYERTSEEKYANTIVVCNELNCKYKWVTFYIDDDNDVVLHNDAILCTCNAADEAFELLVRLVKIADEVKPQLMKAIYG